MLRFSAFEVDEEEIGQLVLLADLAAIRAHRRELRQHRVTSRTDAFIEDLAFYGDWDEFRGPGPRGLGGKQIA